MWIFWRETGSMWLLWTTGLPLVVVPTFSVHRASSVVQHFFFHIIHFDWFFLPPTLSHPHNSTFIFLKTKQSQSYCVQMMSFKSFATVFPTPFLHRCLSLKDKGLMKASHVDQVLQNLILYTLEDHLIPVSCFLVVLTHHLLPSPLLLSYMDWTLTLLSYPRCSTTVLLILMLRMCNGLPN